jgi:hypothetical protein
MKIGRASLAKGVVAVIIVAHATCSYARNCPKAKPGPFSSPIPVGGYITERASAPSQSNISLTDDDEAAIGSGDINHVQINHFEPSRNDYASEPVKIPDQVGGVDVCDVTQNITKLDPPLSGGGEISDLSIEAVVFDAATGKFETANIFDTLANQVGLNKVVSIPDLYADTDGNGVLETGDILYSVVDLNTYLSSIPSFSLGQTFNIVDGTVAGLPGMQFSSTPFSFDQGTGDSTGTPVTLLGIAEAQHDPEAAIPEPSTWSLLALGFSVLALLRTRFWATT